MRSKKTTPREDTKAVYLLLKFSVSILFHGVGDRTVMNKCNLISISILNMTINAIVAMADFSAAKPKKMKVLSNAMSKKSTLSKQKIFRPI